MMIVQDDCSCGKACDFEDELVEAVDIEPAMNNTFTDKGSVDGIETLEHKSGNSIDLMGIANRMTMNVKLEDGSYCQFGNSTNRTKGDHMVLPRRRKVSAVRDFPDAFEQWNEENDSQYKAVLPFDAVKINYFGEGNCASHFEDEPEPIEGDLVPMRNAIEMYLNKEKALNLAANLVGSEEGVASASPLAMLEKAEYVIPLAIQDDDHAEVINQANAVEKPTLENDRGYEYFHGHLENLKPVKPKIVQSTSYQQLKHKRTSIKVLPAFRTRKVSALRNFPLGLTCAGNKGHLREDKGDRPAAFKTRKVSALRDFPLELTCARNKGHLREDNGERPDCLLLEKLVTPKISVEQGIVASTQGQHPSTKKPKRRIIVQALMAATMCPWLSKKSQGSNKRKHTRGKKAELHGGNSPTGP